MEEHQLNSNKNELWNISVKDLFFKYLRFLPFFLLSVALMLFAAYFYLRYSTEIFMVKGTIMIRNDKNSGRQDKLDELFMSSSANNIQNEIEVLKSRPLMARVVKALNLQTSYFAIGKIKSSNIYKSSPLQLEIFEIADSARNFSLRVRFVSSNEFSINKEKEKIKLGQLFKNKNGVFRISSGYQFEADQEYLIKWQSQISAASMLAASVNIQPKGIGSNGLLTISMETANPQMGADIVNQLMIEYGIRSVEIKKVSAQQTIDFIDDRLSNLKSEVDSIEKIKLAYQQKNDLIDVTAQSSNFFNVLTESDQAINIEQERLNLVGLIDAYVKSKKTQHEPFRLSPSALGVEDVTLGELVSGYNLVQLGRKSLLDGGTPPDNPVIKQKEGQIEELRQKIVEALSNIRIASENRLREMRGKNRLVQDQLKQLPEKTRNLLEIDRQLESKQTLYKFLSEKKEETAITRASTIPDADVLDSALVPSAPIKPNRKTIQLLAFIIGIGVPSLFIFFLEILNDKITTRFDIERVTNAAVLGEVGHSFSKDSALVVTSTNRNMVAEQFRIIRSNLQYVLGTSERPVILITSSFSGEGKSFVSTNLGAVMALAGKKTIVLEFDIRKPKIMSGLKLQGKIGITNFLLGKTSFDQLPVLVPGYDNFFVLPCGPVPPNPSELLLGDKVSELFEELKRNFEVILIDTAPVGMVSDAMTLSKFADCTLYMVRQGHTFKKQVILIDEFYKESRLPKISIIINDVKLKPGYGYYGYGRYGYGYGYGQGYYEEEVPKKTLIDKIIDFFDPRLIFKRLRGKN